MAKHLSIWTGPSPERDALCKRLGIEQSESWPELPELDDVFAWAEVGVTLAEGQKEFYKRGPGRPALGGLNNDFLRAVHISGTKGDGTQADAIRRAMKEGVKLFAGDFNSLSRSVSAGNKTIRTLLTYFQLAWAAEFRRECERLRQEKARIEELQRLNAERKPRYGLFGYFHEMTDAQK
jgi:hypothetical protein